MMEKKEIRLHNLATYTKILIQGIFFIAVIFIPIIFPSIQFNNRFELAIILFVALTTSIIFEELIRYLTQQNKDFKLIIYLQLIVSVILLTFFLHFLERINGPLFILYGLTLMESSLNLSPQLASTVVLIMASSTSLEWLWLVKTHEIAPTLINFIFLVIRVIYLFLMMSYGRSLANTVISEKQSKLKAEELSLELQRANKHLKDLDRLKDEFVSVASHELRTPMTAIKSYIWMALNKSKQTLDNQVKGYLKIALISTDRLIRLVQDLLTVSRIEGGRLDFEIKHINLYLMAKQLYQELKVKADEKKINFTLHSDQENIEMEGNADRLREVFQNIVGNALKFTPNNGIVTLTLKKDQNKIEIDIYNSGSYIAKNDIVKLFKKFGRVSHSFSRLSEEPGTGLGLYISQQIVIRHKGKIVVDSDKDKGTTFKIIFPCRGSESN